MEQILNEPGGRSATLSAVRRVWGRRDLENIRMVELEEPQISVTGPQKKLDRMIVVQKAEKQMLRSRLPVLSRLRTEYFLRP